MQTVEKDFNYFYKQDLLKLLNAFNQFMKDILKITVEYFYDIGLDLEVRTAALYTLYAIYFHQMNRPKMKISVTPQQWISILQFIDIINQAEHVDVEYCFRYLLYSDAFEFCSVFETQSVPNLKGYLNKSSSKVGVAKDLNNKDSSSGSQILSMNDFAESIINDGLTEEMGTIHEAYLQLKDELIKSNEIKSKLTYINPDFKQLIGVNFLNEQESENVNTSNDEDDDDEIQNELRKAILETSKSKKPKKKKSKNSKSYVLNDESDDESDKDQL